MNSQLFVCVCVCSPIPAWQRNRKKNRVDKKITLNYSAEKKFESFLFLVHGNNGHHSTTSLKLASGQWTFPEVQVTCALCSTPIGSRSWTQTTQKTRNHCIEIEISICVIEFAAEKHKKNKKKTKTSVERVEPSFMLAVIHSVEKRNGM